MGFFSVLIIVDILVYYVFLIIYSKFNFKIMRKLIIIFFTLVFVSCEQEILNNGLLSNSNKSSSQLLKISDFNYLGSIHNLAMDNVQNNFDESLYPSNLPLESKFDVISNFNVQFIDNLAGYENVIDKVEVTNQVNIHKSLVSNKQLFSYLTDNSSFQNLKLSQMINDLNDNNMIDLFEKNLILSLVDISIKNKNGEISNSELEIIINSQIDKWNMQGYTKNGSYGFISGEILNISLYSVKYWNHGGYSGEKVAPWVAADVGGAIWGAAWGGIVGGSWRAAGVGALGGAIGGSTGIAGRIGKFLLGK